MATFACDMSALPPAERPQHVATIQEVFGAVLDVRELANGYAFQLPGDDGMLMRVAAFVANERRCCPFFGFQIDLAPEGGALWLSLTGEDGVKPFIRAEIGDALADTVALPSRPPRHSPR